MPTEFSKFPLSSIHPNYPACRIIFRRSFYRLDPQHEVIPARNKSLHKAWVFDLNQSLSGSIWLFWVFLADAFSAGQCVDVCCLLDQRPIIATKGEHMNTKLLPSVMMVSLISFGVGCDSSSTDSDPPVDQPCEDCVDLPAAPPAVTSVYPPVFYSGAEVKVSGSYLDQTTVVVNGAPVTSITQSAHELRFVAPELPAGSYQLDIENAYGDELREVTYQTALSASSVSAGSSHTCAIDTGRRVQCWGSNTFGQLGDGNGGFGSTTVASTPVAVSGLSDVVSMAAGLRHTCAVTGDGGVQCWGSNGFGQLGDGNGGGGLFGSLPNFSLTPVTVSGLSDVISVSAGDSHTCAVTVDGGVQCWGNNSRGQLGDGSTTFASTPVAVSGLSDVVSMAAGSLHSCALYRDGVVSCWGDSSAGGSPTCNYGCVVLLP
jgi:hypothetical protein